MTQSKFNVTLPTQDNAGAALAPGQLTSLVFQVTNQGLESSLTYALPAGTAIGASLVVPFSATTPPFAPVGGQAYTADVFAVDSGGNGIPSTNAVWTQLTVPAAPTNFSVS